MRFRDIPGHEDTKARLRSLVDSGRIPHALLLEGPSGSGKFALARALAQYIHCENRADGDSCGRCPSCRQHETFNHIDTIFTFPVVKAKTSGLSTNYLPEFREFIAESMFMDMEEWLVKLGSPTAMPQIYVDEANDLIRRLSYTAHGSKYKVVLLWLPERMREDTANKLLKLVEEPFPDTIFIMTSDNPRLILPTIFSRTQRIAVKRYSDDEVAAALAATQPVDLAQAAEVARLAFGDMNAAARIISVSKESELYLNLFIELMRKAYQRKVADLKVWAADVAALGRERAIHFLEYCARMLRENFILNMRVSQLNYLNEAEMQFSRNFSPFINERNALRLFDVINDARADIAANANGKLVCFDVAIKVILLLKQ